MSKFKRKLKNTKKEVKKEILFNVPNTITLFRLILMFIFIYMLFNDFSKVSIVIVFGVAAATDWLDGFFARKLKQTTQFGARLDYIVDRVFTIIIVVSLIIFAYLKSDLNNVLLLLVLTTSREIIGAPGFLIALFRNKNYYSVKYIGKVTTFVQSVTLGIIIFGFSWAIYSAMIACILGIFSGLTYLKYSLS